MNRIIARLGFAGALLAAVLLIAACGDDNGDDNGEGGQAEEGPITIGAAVDQTDLMQFFDGPALAAAEIEAENINAEGGVAGRDVAFEVRNTRLEPERTKSVAQDLIEQGADVMWVTCDVDWATPSAQEGINAGLLTVSPCIGTDQMGPKRFGDAGGLAFSYGNAAQDEGAALAELFTKNGWESANVVTDQSIAYTQNVCQAFKQRFTENGGEIRADEAFTEGDGTINNVANRINDSDADSIAICATTQEDLPAFVSGVRGGGNDTPIGGPWSIDGDFWLPQNPNVANDIWVITYASVYGDDPNPDVQELIDELAARDQPPATGGFVTGAAALQGIAEAIEQNDGSTDGDALAETTESFDGLETVSGEVSFSADLHTAFGREYRVIEIRNGEPRFVELIEAGEPVTLEE
jgi:branched-chain amino acid transport system substrate-binding protein